MLRMYSRVWRVYYVAEPRRFFNAKLVFIRYEPPQFLGQHLLLTYNPLRLLVIKQHLHVFHASRCFDRWFINNMQTEELPLYLMGEFS